MEHHLLTNVLVTRSPIEAPAFATLQALGPHPHLLAYLSLQRRPQNVHFVVHEFAAEAPLEVLRQRRHQHGLALALAFLHDHDIIHRNLSLHNIRYDRKRNRVRLCDYGLFTLTENGTRVAFPVGEALYMPPELVVASPQRACAHIANLKADVWAFGIVLLQALRGGAKPPSYRERDPAAYLAALADLWGDHPNECDCGACDRCWLDGSRVSDDEDLRSLLMGCLAVHPRDRLSVEALASHPYFQRQRHDDDEEEEDEEEANEEEWTWRWMADCVDVEAHLVQHGRLNVRPPILKMMTEKNETESHTYHREWVAVDCAPSDHKRKKMNALVPLLRHYPASRRAIVEMGPVWTPSLRPTLWPMVLGVVADPTADFGRYVARPLDEETAEQVAKDVPRCHQYDPLLQSRQGREQMTRVLRAWLNSHPEHSYWQGLDSVCAPLVNTFFGREPLAYACLDRIVSTYLADFSDPDSNAFQHRMEYLVELLHVHDASLATHLNAIEFNPRFYAVPWFYTLFSHILPLDRVARLWDALFVQPPGFVLHIALAILHSVRDQLLDRDFDACVSLFANVLDVDVDECIKQALRTFRPAPAKKKKKKKRKRKCKKKGKKKGKKDEEEDGRKKTEQQ